MEHTNSGAARFAQEIFSEEKELFGRHEPSEHVDTKILETTGGVLDAGQTSAAGFEGRFVCCKGEDERWR